jgi:hypothetical protein
VKYAAQLPQLEKVAEKSGFGQELTARQEHNQAREQYRADNTATPDEQQKSTAMFDAFANVQWAPPQKSGPRTYDDKKFFDSLKKQAESGKVLSDKQLLVMARFAAKYSEFIQDFDQLAASLNIPAATAPPAVPLAEQQEVTSLLNAMAAVTQWAEPVKKGGRTYDDKSFVDSIKKQFESGKQLSSKQLFALKKMAGKYVNKE